MRTAGLLRPVPEPSPSEADRSTSGMSTTGACFTATAAGAGSRRVPEIRFHVASVLGCSVDVIEDAFPEGGDRAVPAPPAMGY